MQIGHRFPTFSAPPSFQTTTSHCLACSNHSNHLQPRTPSQTAAPVCNPHPATLHTLHFTLYTLHNILHTLHSIPYTTLHTTFYTLRFTHYTLHSILHTLHCSLYTLPPPPGISTHLQPSPCGLLCSASLQSFLVLPLLFLMF